jgi:hypothetical protein
MDGAYRIHGTGEKFTQNFSGEIGMQETSLENRNKWTVLNDSDDDVQYIGMLG